MNEPFTIPLDGVTYACWREGFVPKHRKLSAQEERKLFTAQDRDRALRELIHAK
jgi:hypothetical protein